MVGRANGSARSKEASRHQSSTLLTSKRCLLQSRMLRGVKHSHYSIGCTGSNFQPNTCGQPVTSATRMKAVKLAFSTMGTLPALPGQILHKSYQRILLGFAETIAWQHSTDQRLTRLRSTHQAAPEQASAGRTTSLAPPRLR